MSIGPWQIVIIAVLLVLLFGANRLSEIGKGLGEGIRSFKKGVGGDEPAPSRKRKKLPEPSEPEQESDEDDAVWERRHANAKRARAGSDPEPDDDPSQKGS